MVWGRVWYGDEYSMGKSMVWGIVWYGDEYSMGKSMVCVAIQAVPVV